MRAVMDGEGDVAVRNTREEDFHAIGRLSREVYPNDTPWTPEQLASHLNVFSDGQLVAIDSGTDEIVGMAASLIISWNDYELIDSYNDFTDRGFFTNHDPSGRTLYGAEVMVHPRMQGRGVGSLLYAARRHLVESLGLVRIRAGARLAGYHRVAGEMSAEEYVLRVIAGELRDPTLSFQLKHGFEVIAVVGNYLHRDPKSRSWAAIIEWINAQTASPEDYAGRDPRFAKPIS
jgi:GNAT superfamily N-acetyltransferase